MPDYDSTLFTPPAPVAFVSFENPANPGKIENVPMLIDTVADVTMIPEFIVSKFNLNLSNAAVFETEAFDGTIGQSYVANVKMIFLEKVFRGDFLTINQEYGIIGRNILNQLMLLFDGKNLSWNEVRPK